jgi:hypothetical protein
VSHRAAGDIHTRRRGRAAAQPHAIVEGGGEDGLKRVFSSGGQLDVGTRGCQGRGVHFGEFGN